MIMALLLFHSAYALESTDNIDTKILKVYNKNVLVLNRGVEDGIFKKDHIKVTSSNGFIARGICIGASMLSSHWKIYRVVRPELVSKDTLYKMKSINQSEIPLSVEAEYAEVDFTPYTETFSDEEVEKQLKLQQRRVVKFDLPQDYKGIAENKRKESLYKQFINQTIEDKKLKEDFSKAYLNVFASPISWQTRFRQKENHYGANLYNYGTKYQFGFNTVETQRKIIDPVSKNQYSSKSTHHDFIFQINKLTEYFSLFSSYSFDKEKIGNTYYPYEYTKIGVLGVKFHIWEEDPKNNFLHLSYIPVLDDITFTNPADSGDKNLRREGIRHLIKLELKSDFTKKIKNHTMVLYAPFNQSDKKEVDFIDTQLKMSTRFSYALGGQFFADYLMAFERDDLRKHIYDVSADNTTNTFRLRYEFEI